MSRLWFLFVIGLAGCGADKSPVQQCDDLVSDLCDRLVQCFPSAGTHATCVQEVQQGLACGAARSVTASYDRCVGELGADSCPVLFPTDPQTGQPTVKLPADCMGVILMRTLPPAPPPTWAREVDLACALDEEQ